MHNIAIILALLLLPYWALMPVHVAEPVRARIGILLVFAFTSIGHFIKTKAMSQMLPAWTSMRVPLIYITGIFELLAAVAIFIPPISQAAGILLCAFLVLILPSNVYAAFQRVDFGGHGMGPRYLIVRIPLQLFLIGWVYWFTVRSPPNKSPEPESAVLSGTKPQHFSIALQWFDGHRIIKLWAGNIAEQFLSIFPALFALDFRIEEQRVKFA